jgi:hypothetical protein
VGRSDVDVHDVLLCDYLGRGGGNCSERDRVAASRRASVVQDADDDHGMCFLNYDMLIWGSSQCWIGTCAGDG